MEAVQRHPRDPKYPVILSRPSYGEVKDNFGPRDYATWALAGGVSLPIGYAIGKGARTPSMLVCGLLGTIGGYLISFQQSSGRLMGYFPNDREVALYQNAAIDSSTIEDRK